MKINIYKILIYLFILECHILYCNPKIDQNTEPNDMQVQSNTERTDVNEQINRSRENAITWAVSNSSPAVVGINVIQIRRYVRRFPYDDDFFNWFYPQQEYQEKVQGLGSGFLISPDGYILTNEHVVHDALKIIVTTTDGKQYEAKKIGEDATSDVSLLKIMGSGFPFIPMGNSDDIIIGEWVIALGNPFGLFDINSKPTVTVGVVSATSMNFKGNLAIEGRQYLDMIQTDASINGGNSGGPLVNSNGECIGINTFILSGSEYQKISIGIGFAIPVNRIKRILPVLKEIGYVDRSFSTGLEVENISWVVANMKGISPRDGVIISGITKNSPAYKSGLSIGDIIVAIDGERIRSTTDIRKIINSIDVTETSQITVTILKDQKLIDVKIILEKP